jgi:hypothetical protein
MNEDKRRARRFDLYLPVQVVAVGEQKPFETVRTRDISSTGLFIEFDQRVQAGTKVELLVTLPREITQAGPVQIHCMGRVVRVERGERERTGIAVSIDRYDFTRVPEPGQKPS